MAKLCVYDTPLAYDIPGVVRIGDHSSAKDFHGYAVNWVARQHHDQQQFAYSKVMSGGFKGCVEWCINNNIDVLNISGGAVEGYIFNNELIAKLVNANIIIVAAAGNDSEKGVIWPARHPDVIAVGAYNTNTKEVIGYSAVGNEVDIVAQGNWIIPTPTGGQAAVHGTSFASPVIAGYAAKWRGLFPKGTKEQFKKFLQENAIDLGLPGKDPKSGWGLFVWPEEVKPIQEEGETLLIEMWIGKNIAKVDGKEVTIDQPPIIDEKTGRTLVPVRFVAETLGCVVEWNEAEKKVTIRKE